MKTSLKTKSLALVLAGLMTVSTAFTGYSAEVQAAVTFDGNEYVTDADLSSNNTEAPAPDSVVPSTSQLNYQRNGMAAFCHFGMNTFTDREWGTGAETPSQFLLDEKIAADEYVEALKDAGFCMLIVTAKHHDGFCIWESDYTDHDIASTNYPGDVLEDLSAACTKYGLDMGLYLSPWDMHEPSYGYVGANGSGTTKENDVNGDYCEFYANQLKEILGNDKYGNNGHFVEVWMDGANNSPYPQDFAFAEWMALIQEYEGIASGKYEEDCMLFCTSAEVTVRWIGNESGTAAEQTWSQVINNVPTNTTDRNEFDHHARGFANGNAWTVPEADARINTGWFYHASQRPKSLQDLSYMYFSSVGHNATLLLNVPLNPQGTLDDDYFERVDEFGTAIKETFANNMAADADAYASSVRGNDTAFSPANVLDNDDNTYWTMEDGQTSGSIILDMGKSKQFDVVSIEEAIQNGQRVTAFKIEYSTDGSSWNVFDEGSTIGSKRLSRAAAVRARYLKVTVETELQDDTYLSGSQYALAHEAKVPMISEIGVYKANEAFEIASAAPDGITVIDERNAAFKFSDGWTNGSGSSFIIDETEKWARSGASFTVDFNGSKIYLIGTIDPGHGAATISIDGGQAIEIDTSGTARQTGQIIFTSDDLEDKAHTLTLNCTGTIGIDGAYVINNGGLGMVGIEETKYEMAEDSQMEVTLVRQGGTKGEVTVQFAPNPGSAFQKHFDTALVQDITFAEGETTKTAKVKTLRDETETGDLYFTVELSTQQEGVILGFNDKATVTIKDSEANLLKLPEEKGVTKRLEAENCLAYGEDPSSTAWPINIADDAARSGGKYFSDLNHAGDWVRYEFNAPCKGTYKVNFGYFSGSNANAFTVKTVEGEDATGTGVIVSDGVSSVNGNQTWNVGEFTITVTQPGRGVLEIQPRTNAGAPRFDYFDFELIEYEKRPVNIKSVGIGEHQDGSGKRYPVNGQGEVIIAGEAIETNTSDGVVKNVEVGESITFVPKEGFKVQKVLVNDQEQENLNSYTVPEGTGDLNIKVIFEPETFELPAELGEENSKILELENVSYFYNDSNGWAMRITEANWASGGMFLNGLESAGDIVQYKFNAPYPGTYKVKVHYRSGNSSNGIRWYTLDDQGGFIEPGELNVGDSGNNVNNDHLEEFTMTVSKAGEGVLVLAIKSSSEKGSQLDYMKFELESYAERPVTVVSEGIGVMRDGNGLGNNIRQVAGQGKAIVDDTEITVQTEVLVGKTIEFVPDTGFEVKEVFVNDVSQGKIDSYTVEYGEENLNIRVIYEPLPFELPETTGTTATLQAENVSYFYNGGTTWAMRVQPAGGWATTPYIDGMNNDGDEVRYKFSAPNTGVYNVTLGYTSGDSNNGFSITTLNAENAGYTGAIANGTLAAGNVVNDPNNLNEITFKLVVERAGEGVLVVKPGNKNAPRLDYFKFVLSVDTAELAAVIQNAKALTEENYEPASWETLENQLAVAEAALKDSTHDQESIAQITNALRGAILGLIPRYVVDFGVPVQFELPVAEGDTVAVASSNASVGTVSVGADNVITYTPNGVLTKVDTLNLVVNENTQVSVNMYPANSVYYEEKFMTPDTNWTLNSVDAEVVQEGAKTADTQKAADAAFNYGYDEAYLNRANSELMTNVLQAKTVIKFKGTGLDVYANCAEGTGIAMAMIRNAKNELVSVVSVDTKLKPGNNDKVLEGKITMNVPVISVSKLPYGEYEVTIVHQGRVQKDENGAVIKENGKVVFDETTLRLDGFRVYGTLENTDVYSADLENNAVYTELRDAVLGAITVDPDSTTEAQVNQAMNQVDMTGAVVFSSLDKSQEVYTGEALDDFLYNGSKNELYLYPGQCVVFTLPSGTENPQIALRKLTTDAVTCEILEDADQKAVTVGSTEMYYTLEMKNNAETTFTIANTGDAGILAVTKLKVNGATANTAVVYAETTVEASKPAMMLLGLDVEQEPTNDSVTDVFVDVAEGEWYVDAVQYVYNADLMTGNGNLFNPTKDVTRAQVVTTLYRMAGRPEVTDYKVCEELGDVAANDWYTDAVAWAYNTGITTGNTTTKMFNVNEPVTRQQLAAFMYRYASYQGIDVTASADISGMLNADQVADYAQTAVKWAVAEGIISGSESTAADGTIIYDLKPQATATRAQMAKILMNFDCTFNK